MASRRAWRSHLSADVMTLLDAVAYEPTAAWTNLSEFALTERERCLVWDARHMTVNDLTFHSIGTLLALARGPLHESNAVREVAA